MNTAEILNRQIAEEITGEVRIIVGFLASAHTAETWCLPHAEMFVWAGGGVRMAVYGSAAEPRSKEGYPVGMGARAFQGFTFSTDRLYHQNRAGRRLSQTEVAELFGMFDELEQPARWAQYADAMDMQPIVTNTEPIMLGFPGTPDQFLAKFY